MLALTIKQKLYGLAALVLVAFTIFGLVYGYATGIRADAAAEIERSLAIHNAEAEARIALLQSRRNEKDCLLRKNEKYIEKHAKTMQALYGHLQHRQNNVSSDEGHADVRTLRALSHEYEQGFKAMNEVQIRVGINEKSGI